MLKFRNCILVVSFTPSLCRASPQTFPFSEEGWLYSRSCCRSPGLCSVCMGRSLLHHTGGSSGCDFYIEAKEVQKCLSFHDLTCSLKAVPLLQPDSSIVSFVFLDFFPLLFLLPYIPSTKELAQTHSEVKYSSHSRWWWSWFSVVRC